MKKKQRLGILALCIAVMLTLAACGGGNDPAPSQEPEGSSQSQSQEPASSQDPAPVAFPVDPVWVVEPKYDVLNAFEYSEVTTAKRDGAWYLLDKEGNELKRIPYDGEFLETHAAVDPMDPDATKELVLYSFAGGLAKMNEVYSDGSRGVLGYIDENGELVIDLSLADEDRKPMSVLMGSETGSFSGDITWKAPASTMAWNEDTFQFIDKTGKVVFNAPAGIIYGTGSYSEGLCGQVLEDGSIRYLDTQGQTVISLEGDYVDCGNMKNGYAWFTTADGTEGIMDRSGAIVLEPVYTAVGDVNEDGICSFEDGATGLRGLMRIDGTVVLPAQYQNIYTPREGLTYFSMDGVSYGLLNAQGEVVVEPKFEFVSSPYGGICMAKQDGKWGFFKNPLEA